MSTERFRSRDLVRVPNLLSLSRVLFAGLFPLALIRGPLPALLVLAIAGASDLLDGWWARHFRQQTALGATIDGATDKIFVLTVVLTLVLTQTMTLTEALLLGTRDLGEIALAGRLYLMGRHAQSRSRQPALALDETWLKKPHLSNIPGKVATALQYVAVVAIILGTSLHAFWIGIAAIAGVIASVTYWIREVPTEHQPTTR